MQAVAVFPSEREARVIDHPEPHITSPTEAKMRVLDVGVCGTDREIVTFQYGTPPEGFEYLVIGHESLSEVIETGPAVTRVKPGDLVVITVRRPCPHESCIACREGRQDFCYTGDYTERGIKSLHGFMTEFVVEEERYLNVVPRPLRDIGVLVEPLTIAEKSLEQLARVQQRLPWASPVEPGTAAGAGHRAVVLGAGPVGLLGAMALRVSGYEVAVYSRSPEHVEQNDIAAAIGARYLAAETHSIEQLAAAAGPIDVVYEATGASGFAFEVIKKPGPECRVHFHRCAGEQRAGVRGHGRHHARHGPQQPGRLRQRERSAALFRGCHQSPGRFSKPLAGRRARAHHAALPYPAGSGTALERRGRRKERYRDFLVSDNWIDISVPLHTGMVHWPGDAPFERRPTLALANGDACNLSEIRGSAHTGTHMDAPVHFLEAGLAMDAMPIEATVGPARVIEIHDPRLIRIAELAPHNPAPGERLLFKTSNSPRCWKTDKFQDDYVSIPPDTASYLADIGVRTVGVDYLSVGHGEEEGAETHRILLKAGIWIIEGLNLDNVAPGDYELVCLPLKIAGGDGSPARAVLRKWHP